MVITIFTIYIDILYFFIFRYQGLRPRSLSLQINSEITLFRSVVRNLRPVDVLSVARSIFAVIFLLMGPVYFHENLSGVCILASIFELGDGGQTDTQTLSIFRYSSV
jgi:hypothetical protein